MLVKVPAVATKVVTVAPPGTVTDAGAVNNGLLLDSETTDPPAGAAIDRVSVQVDPAPLARLEYAQVKELTDGNAVSERLVVCAVELYVAVIVAA